jgi:methionyl-tRNA synthetase
MVTRLWQGQLGRLDEEGKELVSKIAAAKQQIVGDYECLNFAGVVRAIVALSDEADRFLERREPWVTVKTDLERTQATLTAAINAVRILTIYLKPILPKYAQKVERFLNIDALSFADVEKLLENHKINEFERLFERVDEKQVNAMVEESKETQGPKAAAQPAAAQAIGPSAGGFKPECTMADFEKIDLRIAKVIKAEAVAGADKLLRLQLDVGGVQKSVLAAIATAYRPEDLADKMVVYFANLKPRQMRFGLSEGMIMAAGSGGKDIYMLTVDAGAKPGLKVL